MSSAAAILTSTGNMTWSARPATPARNSASTSSRDSRGTAYSDSTNLTRRGVTKTSCDGAEYVRFDRVAAASRFSGLIVAGTARPVLHSAPKAAFSITSYSKNRRQRGMGEGTAAFRAPDTTAVFATGRASGGYGPSGSGVSPGGTVSPLGILLLRLTSAFLP